MIFYTIQDPTCLGIYFSTPCQNLGAAMSSRQVCSVASSYNLGAADIGLGQFCVDYGSQLDRYA